MLIKKMKRISRREAISLITFGATMSLLPSLPNASEIAGRVSEITNGSSIDDLEIILDMPEIAENGNQVKISFDIDSPMTPDNYVKSVYILADGNPEADVARFDFTSDMGACSATTRMRLAKTQNVHVIAALNNGSFGKAETKVKVTIGGCGG